RSLVRRPFGVWAFGIWWLVNAAVGVFGLYIIASNTYPADTPPLLASAARSLPPLDLVGNALIAISAAASGVLLLLLRRTALVALTALVICKVTLEVWDMSRIDFSLQNVEGVPPILWAWFA